MPAKLMQRKRTYSLMLYLGGFGAAMFGVQGAAKAWDLGFGLSVAPAMLVIIAAIGGGMIRDALAGRPTLLMRRELCAMPVCLGCIAFTVVLRYLPDCRLLDALVCIIGTFALRAAAIHWNLSMPTLTRTGGDAG